MLLHKQPESIRCLGRLLTNDPKPSKLEITILPFDETIYEGDEIHTSQGIGNDDDSRMMELGIPFIKIEGHVGIHAPYVPFLAKYFRKEYYSIRSLFIDYIPIKRNDPKSHNDLVLCDTAIDDEKYNQTDNLNEIILPAIIHRMLDVTTCLLAICPDHATAWADRKRALFYAFKHAKSCISENEKLFVVRDTIWKNEIEYLDLLFSQHSKAPNSWSHRKWIYKQRCQHQRLMNHIQKTSFDLFWEKQLSYCNHEIKSCVSIASYYPKNYYAWTHRLFIVQSLSNIYHNIYTTTTISFSRTDGTQNVNNHINEKTERNPNIIKYLNDVINTFKSEVESIHLWLKSHVTDHSAANYGGQILGMMLSLIMLHQDNPDAEYRSLLQNDVGLFIEQNTFTSASALCSTSPSYEVIWLWKRICGQIYLEYLFRIPSMFGSQISDIKMAHKNAYDFVMDEIDKTKQLVEHKKEFFFSSIHDSEEERKCSSYSSSYLVWLIRRFRMFSEMYGDVSISDNHNIPFDVDESEYVKKLALDDSICHNFWRLKI